MNIKRPSRTTWLQALAAAAILCALFGATFLPAMSTAKLDTGLVETLKNIALVVVGWLFGSSARDTHSPAEPAPPQLEKDSLR